MTVGFAEANYDIQEGDGSVTVCVDLTGQINIPLTLSIFAEGDKFNTKFHNKLFFLLLCRK